MKVPAVKINTVTPKKPTPIKDALIVSAYCSMPIVLYEAACRISKKVNERYSDSFEYQGCINSSEGKVV